MHEMSLAEGIIQLLEDQAKAQDFSRVKQVWLSIGELAGVEVEALDFCLEVVSRDTLAAGARFTLCASPVKAGAWPAASRWPSTPASMPARSAASIRCK
jgi:hydrogenase nickel incorporation protein HypA/HybF